MSSFADSFRTWRRRFKAALPYVRRREYRILERKYEQLIDALHGQATPAADAKLHIEQPLAPGLSGDVCLFVTFAPQPIIKPHVVEHIEHLLGADIRVVLIVNTELPGESFTIDAGFQRRLSGVLIRQNIGFDFGAWAHALSLAGNRQHWTRLLLINDSIVGPVNSADFKRLIERLRGSAADLIGLTENLLPRRHLQSYFLLLNARALQSQAVERLFRRMLNFPTKSQVIDMYETRLTGLLADSGLRCDALFPSLWDDRFSSDDTSLRWQELLRAGFPYVKARMLPDGADGMTLTR